VISGGSYIYDYAIKFNEFYIIFGVFIYQLSEYDIKNKNSLE